MFQEKSPKISYKFFCEVCDYKCSRQSEFNKHNSTAKHRKLTNASDLLTDVAKNLPEASEKIAKKQKYICKCGKTYNHDSSYYRHKKTCKKIGEYGENDSENESKNESDNEEENEEQDVDNSDDEDLYNLKDKDKIIIHLLKQNGSLQKSLIEMSKEKSITTNNSHNTNTNCHNKQFNLNFFLNETCKNALNMSEFVDLIKPTLEDLENTGRKGYVEGITDLIMKTLKALEQCKRPIHCSDLKRAVLYVKDNDKWEKETEDKPILTNAIKCIAYENIKKIGDWKNKYPDCTNADSRKNDLYLKIVSNAMSGLSEEECAKNMHKIIANLVKETTIDKDIDI